MIVFLRVLDVFNFETVDELVKKLKNRNLISLSLEEVKLEVKKSQKDFDWDDSEVIQYILEELADGYFELNWNEEIIYTVGIIDKNKPFKIEGKKPKLNEKVAFT